MHPHSTNIHGRKVAAALAASAFSVFNFLRSASLLGRFEVDSSEMGGCVVVGIISFFGRALFAVCEELLARGDVNTDEGFA